MSKVAKPIDPDLIERMKRNIKDPVYIHNAVEIMAEAISSRIFGERG